MIRMPLALAVLLALTLPAGAEIAATGKPATTSSSFTTTTMPTPIQGPVIVNLGTPRR